MPAAEPPTAAPPALALALEQIAQLRAEGFDLVVPEAGELARLRKGTEIVIVPLPPDLRGAV